MSSAQPAQTNERIANVVVDSLSPFQTQLCGVPGRRKDFFPRGATRVFFQNFSRGGAKVVKFVFSDSKQKKNLFWVKLSIS